MSRLKKVTVRNPLFIDSLLARLLLVSILPIWYSNIRWSWVKRVSIIIHYLLSLLSSLFLSLAHKLLFVFSNMSLIYAFIVYVYHISNILNFLHLFCHLTFSVTSLHVVSLLRFPYWSSSLNCLSFPCSFLLPSSLDVDDGIQLPHFNTWLLCPQCKSQICISYNWQ